MTLITKRDLKPGMHVRYAGYIGPTGGLVVSRLVITGYVLPTMVLRLTRTNFYVISKMTDMGIGENEVFTLEPEPEDPNLRAFKPACSEPEQKELFP